MAVDIGPKIGIDGEKEFRQELNQINTTLKTLGTEMKKFLPSSRKMRTARRPSKRRTKY